MTVLWIALGVALALVYLRLGDRRGGRAARIWWSGGLVAAAGLYIVFALLEGAGDAELAAEVAGVALFGGMALLGLRGHLGWTAAGWLLHAGWDVAVQTALGVGPAWYVWLCVGFDAVVGAALYLRAVRR